MFFSRVSAPPFSSPAATQRHVVGQIERTRGPGEEPPPSDGGETSAEHGIVRRHAALAAGGKGACCFLSPVSMPSKLIELL